MKLEDGEIPEDAEQNAKTKDLVGEGVNGNAALGQSDGNPFDSHQTGFSRRDGHQRNSKVVNAKKKVLPS